MFAIVVVKFTSDLWELSLKLHSESLESDRCEDGKRHEGGKIIKE